MSIVFTIEFTELNNSVGCSRRFQAFATYVSLN